MALWPWAISAEPIRFATFNTELDRKGPGLLLRDIQRGKDAQIKAVLQEIIRAKPDVIVLQRFDWDAERRAMRAFQEALALAGWSMPYGYAPRPNSGVQTGLDVNKNGRLNDAQDAQGYGRFAGNRGLLILSTHPILHDYTANWTEDTLWKNIPNSRSADPAELAAVQRLASVAHVRVSILVGEDVFYVDTLHATTPVFDGPEDRNGRRNADEIRFAQNVQPPPNPTHWIFIGALNNDPNDGEGLKEPILNLLGDPAFQDPRPTSTGAIAVANSGHAGNASLDTVDWQDEIPGNLRVSYILPSSALQVKGAGVQWDVGHENTASRHRLVWVDVTVP